MTLQSDTQGAADAKLDITGACEENVTFWEILHPRMVNFAFFSSNKRENAKTPKREALIETLQPFLHRFDTLDSRSQTVLKRQKATSA